MKKKENNSMRKRQRLTQFIFLSIILLVSSAATAQQNIKGKISSSAGGPVVAATVSVKGTNKSVVSDNNGNFTINAAIGSTLQISSVGFAAKEVAVTGADIDEVLQVTNATLNDVVVIGYQTVRRKDLTGATSVVSTENSSKITGNSVAEQLQGQTPGVTVRNSGAPGQNAAIEIRGVASFTDASPLYVIDGMIADANSTVNTDDIASIQILKDASAAAIYGSRAANGVIIITTKKGKPGPSKITFTAKYGIQQIPKKWDVMNASEYLATLQTQYANSNATIPSGIAAQIANPTVNTDWQNAFDRTGNTQDYNLGISGGSENGNYLISGSYFNNQGVLIGNNFERASLRINTEAKKGRLTVGENILISNTDGQNPGGGINAFYEGATSVPVIPVQNISYIDPAANPKGYGFGTNAIPNYSNNYVAVAALDMQKYNYSKLVGNSYLDFKITDWLSYRFNAGLEVSFDYNTEQRDSGIYRYGNQLPATSIYNDRETFTNYLIEHTLNFNKTLGNHAINGVVGYSYQQQKREVTSGSRLGLTTVGNSTFTTISSAQGAPSTDGGVPLFFRLQGYLGRVNYSFKDKYLFTASGRIDQDSRFGANYRTGDFYSVAGAWRISKENFFHVNGLNDLKLRASYGQLGISSALQDLAGSWPTLGYININQRAVYGVNQTPVLGESQAIISNPDLRWEERDETNIGADATLLNSHLTITADVYNNISKGVLVGVPLPFFLGSDNGGYNTFSTENAASIRNQGIELTLTYRHQTGAFKWDVSVNGTTIHNKVISVGNQGGGINYIEPTDFVRSQVGHPMDSWFMLKTAGLFQNQAQIDGYVDKNGNKIQPNAKPGDIKYVDVNGDGQINNDDRTFVGSPWPTFQGGLQFNGSYKNFYINVQFVGVFGYKIYDDVRRVLDSYTTLNNFRKGLDPWTPANTNTSDPRLGLATDPGINSNNYPESDRWLENGSYFRLRNVELAYTFPKNILKSINFTNTRIFVSGQNLFTITKYKGQDPDLGSSGLTTRGFDQGNWPSSRIFSFGITGEF
jgi:TonB-linked SusC/RagA family outer membrane protein